MSVSPACMYVHLYQYLIKVRKSVWAPGTEATDGCQEPDLSPLQEHQELLTAESSLQSLNASWNKLPQFSFKFPGG